MWCRSGRNGNAFLTNKKEFLRNKDSLGNVNNHKNVFEALNKQLEEQEKQQHKEEKAKEHSEQQQQQINVLKSTDSF